MRGIRISPPHERQDRRAVSAVMPVNLSRPPRYPATRRCGLVYPVISRVRGAAQQASPEHRAGPCFICCWVNC